MMEGSYNIFFPDKLIKLLFIITIPDLYIVENVE